MVWLWYVLHLLNNNYFLAFKFKYTWTLNVVTRDGRCVDKNDKKCTFCFYWASRSARRLIKMSWGRVRIVTAPPVALSERSHGSDDPSCIVNRQRSWSPWPCLHGLFKSPPSGHIISTRNTPYRVYRHFYFTVFSGFLARFVLACRHSMYRSLYAFRSAEPNSLHFAAGESFLILERSNKHWWLGSRCTSGETGYVPASYIEKIQVKDLGGSLGGGWWSSRRSQDADPKQCRGDRGGQMQWKWS